jgi:hypothetical protein
MTRLANVFVNPLTKAEYPWPVNHSEVSEAQLEAMIDWYILCKTQTIYFYKYSGDQYEVLITDFKPTEKKTIHNPKDFANAPLWYWNYTITIEVVTVLSGVWQGIVT